MSSNNEADAFLIGVFMTAIIMIIAISNYSGVRYNKIKAAQKICKKYNSDLTYIYFDYDFECKNGAEFNSNLLDSTKSEEK
tara:strand:+ start:2625 stop:2867 length:243 start_codon:yes stop_codon:yes gene_type:complete